MTAHGAETDLNAHQEATSAGAPRFIPDRYLPWFAGWFRRYSVRKLTKSFFAVRTTKDSYDLASAPTDRPLIVALTHAAWWDPLLSMAMHELTRPQSRPTGPMDADQLERFGVFRRVGVFGVDPADPASLEAMRAHVLKRFESDPGAALWLTPQGAFADPRAPLVVRPGMAAVAAAVEGVTVVTLAVEYAFWVDQKPEIFLCARRAEQERRSTAGWQRAIVASFEDARSSLAERVIARDPEAFDVLLGGDAVKTNPVWDLVLKLRGKSGSIEPRSAGRSTGART
ncbi:MAG: 1-acyl-sn-glycerol-3-phosphate acyltransferase [Planctomycetota bacterium]